ncbi:growth factor receptor-bound protein 2-like [Argonauta hians]
MDVIEAIGKHDFHASSPDELSFKRGDYLQIIDMETDPNWYRAQMKGNTGYIPNNYIEIIHKDNWLMLDVTRPEAEKMLLAKGGNGQYINGDGAFLVRRGRQEGEHSLSVKYMCEVQHFKIYRQNDGHFIWESDKFPTLGALVNFYKSSSVSRSHHITLKEIVKEQKVKARGIYEFTARGSDELSFKKGEIIDILDQHDLHWWSAQNLHNQTGLIPATYVELI